MPRPRKGAWPRSYSEADRVALVTEIERRFRAGEGSIKAIAAQLGTCEASYHNWTKAGVKANQPPQVRRYEPLERERILAEIGHLESTGLSLTAACEAAGVSIRSLRRWQVPPDSEIRLRPVEVTDVVPVAAPALAPAPQLALSLVAPGGYRLEGLSVESAAALLRALA